MSASELSTRFVIFIVVSLITHLMELSASGLFCYTLIQQTDLRMPWFSVAAGLLILPMVAVQLSSAVFLLKRKSETSSTCEVITTAILHVLQLGFIGRHFIILKDAPLSSKRTEVLEMMLLRVSFAFSSGCTLFLMQIYLLLQGSHEQTWTWAVYVSGVTTLISVSWGVSTFRRFLPEPEFGALLISWPGTVLRIFWRAGEILARIIATGLFASLYTHFLILVIGLHWLSMLVCLYIPLITSLQWSTTGSVKRTIVCLMISFAHIFAFINTSSENAVFRYTFYFVIFFMENVTLIVVWFIQSSRDQFSRNNVYAYVGVIVFVASLTSMIVYYKFFHVAALKATSTGARESCVTCNHGDTSSLHPVLSRQAATENWLKPSAGESIMDSDINSTVTASSSHAQHQQLYIIEDDVKERGLFHNTRTRNDRLGICALSISSVDEKRSSVDRVSKNTSKKRCSGGPELQISSTNIDPELTVQEMSQKRPVWLPSGDSNFASQLLTYGLQNLDVAEAAANDRSSIITGYQGYHNSCSSSPLDIISSPGGNNKAVIQGETLAHKSCEHNSFQADSNNGGKSKNAATSLPNAPWTDSCDSLNECVSCCQCSRGVSDMLPLEHSIKTVPGADITTTDGTIPQCLQADVNHQHILHLSITKVHQHDDLQTQDSESQHEHNSPNDRDNSQVNPPSLACGLDYDRTKKVSHPSKHKVQTFAFVDKCNSHSALTDQQCARKDVVRDEVCSDSKSTEHSRAHNERLAVELLKSSFQTEKHISIDKSDMFKCSGSDPRFTVRVMVSPVEENSSFDCDGITDALNKAKTVNNVIETVHKLPNLWSSLSEKPDPSDGQVMSNIYDLINNVYTDKSKEILLMSSRSVNDGVRSHTKNNSGKLALHSLPDPDEVVYENLWPVILSEGGKKCQTATEALSGKSERHDIYVCSESEDSALPQEVLSSSAEVFTASDSDSDVSLEIVI